MTDEQLPTLFSNLCLARRLVEDACSCDYDECVHDQASGAITSVIQQLDAANRKIERLEEMEKRAKSEYTRLWSASTPAEVAGVSTSINATALRSLRFILGLNSSEEIEK